MPIFHLFYSTQYWKCKLKQLVIAISNERNKIHLNWKGRSNQFANDIIIYIYIENSKNSTQKKLEVINEFSKVAGYKVNIQNSVAFLYTNNKSKKENYNKVPFTIASKRISYLEL